MYDEFSPPDEGLKPGESILWNRRAGMAASMMIGGAFCLVFSPWILLLAFASFGQLVGNWAFLMVVAYLLLALFELVTSRRTMYYLTTHRLLEVRGGLIQKQMALELLREAQATGELVVKSTYREGASQYYSVKIRDPSSRKLFRLSGLDEESKEFILNTAQS